MAFFPHVKKGDTFQPSAVLENNIRDVVNGFNAIGARVTKGIANSSIRVPVWNASQEELTAGMERFPRRTHCRFSGDDRYERRRKISDRRSTLRTI